MTDLPSEEEIRLAFQVASTMHMMHRALKLVIALDDKPEANVPGYAINLDPKAREQVDAAIAKFEYFRDHEMKEIEFVGLERE